MREGKALLLDFSSVHRQNFFLPYLSKAEIK